MNHCQQHTLKLLRTVASAQHTQQRGISHMRRAGGASRKRFSPRFRSITSGANVIGEESWGILSLGAVVVALSASSALSSSLEQEKRLPLANDKNTTPISSRRASPARRHQHGEADSSTMNKSLPQSAQQNQQQGPVPMHSKYEIDWGHLLGRGAYGSVHLAYARDGSGDAVALKRIARFSTDSEAFQRESGALLKIQKLGGHESILGLRDMFEDDDYFYLVLDLAHGGEVYDDFCDNGTYNEQDAAHIVTKVSNALAFLHDKAGLVHADLKPENLLLDSNNRSTANVKLIDFGCATAVENGTTKPTESGGTTAYWSPERFEKGACAHPASDMWSLGVILYILLADCHPFDRQGISTDEEIQTCIRTCEGVPMPEGLSAGAEDVLSRLLCAYPEERMTAQELAEHPWVQQQSQLQTSKVSNKRDTPQSVLASSILA